MRNTICLLMFICAAQLAAQTLPPGTPTPDPTQPKESFVMQPGAVDRGARGLAIRMVANDPAGFANSSSKQPTISFGAGATLSPGTFQLLNQNEAQCSIDVDEDAESTIEVSIELFSVNGTTVLKTLRATLGVKGTSTVSGSQAKVGVESVLLVQANVEDPQPAGVIVISGSIAGTVSIKAPTGCAFEALPTATATSGTINTPKLDQANTILTFGIGNSTLADVTVRVEGIEYNTQFFGLVGGVEGDLACEISGGALSNQTALVINAFTAKTPIQGSNDNGDAPPPTETPATGSESSASTSNPNSGTSVNTGSRPLDSSSNNRADRNNRRTNNGGGRSSTPLGSSGESSRPGSSGFRPVPNRSGPLPNTSAPSPGPAGGGGVISKSGGSSGAGGGSGSISQENTSKDEMDKKLETKTEPKVLEVSPGLHFCDKDFKPVTALVLDKIIADEAGGRVWIVLKVKKDKNPDKAETLTVKLTVNGTSRELALTETGKNTGEFRCGKDGILVVANENPDSNAEEKTAEPPKPRFPR